MEGSKGGRDRTERVWGVVWGYGRLKAPQGSRRWLGARARAGTRPAYWLEEEDDRSCGGGLGHQLAARWAAQVSWPRLVYLCLLFLLFYFSVVFMALLKMPGHFQKS